MQLAPVHYQTSANLFIVLNLTRDKSTTVAARTSTTGAIVMTTALATASTVAAIGVAVILIATIVVAMSLATIATITVLRTFVTL